MNRSFTKNAWNNLNRQEQRVAAANMEVVSVLAKLMGATINIVGTLQRLYDVMESIMQGETYTDATKLAYGNRKGSTPDQKVTEKLADDFPELIGTSSYAHSKKESGGKNEAHNGVLVWHYFANHIGFVHESGSYAEYNVFIDVKQKDTGHFVYAVGAEKIKGSERSKASTLYSDPKTLLASGSGIAPTIADNIILDDRENVKYSYAGQTAKTADHDMLTTAREMRDDGVDNETIRKETGWFVGKDGKWRFEMDDSQSRVKLPEGNYNELGDLLENSKILEAYPEMANMKVIFQGLENGQYGQYDAKFDTIDLAYELKTKPKELRYALLHELQHAIQHRERFATGASVAYWQRRIDEGFDTRTAKQKEAEAKAEEALRRVLEEKPEFYHYMMNLRKMLPDVPRGKVDWDTLEQLEEDPVEWQEYDAQRDLLEDKYGVEAMFDFDDLLHDREKAMRSERSATDLYFATAGEIEARNVEGRADLTAEERRQKAPVLGGEDTVFSRRETQRIGGDLRYSRSDYKEAQKKYAGVDLSTDSSVYTYDFLTSLPDMETTQMATEQDVKVDGKINKAHVVELALTNAAAFGTQNGNGMSVQNRYTGRKMRLTTKALRHSLGRENYKGQLANAEAVARAAELAQRAIPLNALFDTSSAADGTYAMGAYLVDENKNEHIAILTVEQRSGDVVEMEVYDTLHALNTRKRNVVDQTIQTASDAEEQHLTSPTRSTISIAELLEIVNETHQSLLSEDVLGCFGEERNPAGYYSDRVKFSLSDYDDTVREGENVLEELLTMTAAHRMTDAEAARVARKVLKAASSEMDLDEATQRIKSIFDYASRSGNRLDMQGLSSEATALAEDMLSESKTLDMQHEEDCQLRYQQHGWQVNKQDLTKRREEAFWVNKDGLALMNELVPMVKDVLELST